MVAQVFGRDAKESSCSRRSCDVNQHSRAHLLTAAGCASKCKKGSVHQEPGFLAVASYSRRTFRLRRAWPELTADYPIQRKKNSEPPGDGTVRGFYKERYGLEVTDPKQCLLEGGDGAALRPFAAARAGPPRLAALLGGEEVAAGAPQGAEPLEPGPIRLLPDKEATVRLFQGLGLEFTQYGEGHHMEATTGGMTIMVDTLELMKRSKPDYKFSPETCAVHLAFKCDTSAAVDELFAKLQGKGETQKEQFLRPHPLATLKPLLCTLKLLPLLLRKMQRLRSLSQLRKSLMHPRSELMPLSQPLFQRTAYS
ncbi:unnamed protein product, partial [Effrenium voratum]